MPLHRLHAYFVLFKVLEDIGLTCQNRLAIHNHAAGTAYAHPAAISHCESTVFACFYSEKHVKNSCQAIRKHFVRGFLKSFLIRIKPLDLKIDYLLAFLSWAWIPLFGFLSLKKPQFYLLLYITFRVV